MVVGAADDAGEARTSEYRKPVRSQLAAGADQMTAQLREDLILDGEETSMAFCPPLPKRHPRIYEAVPDVTLTDEMDLITDDFILWSTACWRRYQGTWEVRCGRFYLIGLRGRYQLREGGPIFADWFSGVLRVPKGNLLNYVHCGFGSVYEQEIHIEIKGGLVMATVISDNRRDNTTTKN